MRIISTLVALILLSQIAFAQETEKFLYKGYAEIEYKQFEEIIKALENANCMPQGENNGCYYEKGTLYPNTNNSNSSEITTVGIDVITIHPNGATFGPDNLIVTQSRLYAVRDIEGPQNDEKYKEDVRKSVRILQNFVSIKESSWNIESEDSSDMAFGVLLNSGNDKRLSEFVMNSESMMQPQINTQETKKSYTLWIILGIMPAIALGLLLYKMRK